MSTLLDEHLGRVLRDEEAGRVADRVAGPAAHAEQLRLGLGWNGPMLAMLVLP